MSGLLRWFMERVPRVRGSLLPAYRAAYGEEPRISLGECLEAYVKDPSCRAFVDFLADQAVGMGFYITVDEGYERADEARMVIEDFCEAVNLDGLLQVGVREIIAAGNSFWEKVEPDRLEDLRILPLTSIESIRRDVYGRVLGYKQTAAYGGRTLPPERIIHFRWNPINGEPFGTGILRTLLERFRIEDMGETRMSFLEMKARIERMLPEIFEKYAGPDELWIFEGISDEQLAEYQRVIRSRPKTGTRFIYNRKADIKTVQIDPRTQFQAYLEHILNQVYLGGQTPLPKLFTTPGFTEASARAAVEMAERRVTSLQRFLRRVIEGEVFTPLLRQAGIDPKMAKVRLRWGTPRPPEVRVEDMLRAFELGAISKSELRSMLRRSGWQIQEA